MPFSCLPCLPQRRATPQTHPREFAIFRKVDKNKDGRISREEVIRMCHDFDAAEHASVLADLLGVGEHGAVRFQAFCSNFRAISMVRQAARLKQWHRCYGLGVAGNVAGHMAQAGEADATATAAATPAAVFTFYAPHPHSVDAPIDEVLARLETFPVTNAVIDFPTGGSNVQVEPEMGLYVDVVYSQDGKAVERLVPRRVAAFNDCSIRQLEGAEKLFEKKNWGFGSKGISLRSFRVASISPGTLVDRLVLVSYLKRSGVVEQYSVAAPARNYLMFHEPLLDWIVERINKQRNEGKWEAVFPRLVDSDYPTSMWIALGAGEYTEWGQKNFLKVGDEALVIVYDEEVFREGPDAEVVGKLFEDSRAPEGLIALHQTFVLGSH